MLWPVRRKPWRKRDSQPARAVGSAADKGAGAAGDDAEASPVAARAGAADVAFGPDVVL
ncbi:MAG: hypothetical protein ACO28J_05940 [Limnohabitans sp.]